MMNGFQEGDIQPPLEKFGSYPIPTNPVEPVEVILGKLALPEDVEISEPDAKNMITIKFHSILDGDVTRQMSLEEWYSKCDELGFREGLNTERMFNIAVIPFTRRSSTKILPMKTPVPKTRSNGYSRRNSDSPPTLIAMAPQKNGQVEEEPVNIRSVTRSETRKKESGGNNSRSSERVSLTMGRNPVEAAPVVETVDEEDEDEDEIPSSTSGTAEERGRRKSKKERKKKKRHHRRHREERTHAEDGADNEAQVQSEQVANETGEQPEMTSESQESAEQTTSGEQVHPDQVSDESRRTSTRKRPNSATENRTPIHKIKIRRTGTVSMEIVPNGGECAQENAEEKEQPSDVDGQLDTSNNDQLTMDTTEESSPMAEMSVAFADATEERRDDEHNKTAASPVETGTAERSLPKRGKNTASAVASKAATTPKSVKQTNAQKQKEKTDATKKATKAANNNVEKSDSSNEESETEPTGTETAKNIKNSVPTHWHSADYDSVENVKLDAELIGNSQKTFESIITKTPLLKGFFLSDKEWMASVPKEKQMDHRDAVTVKYVYELSTHYAEARHVYPTLFGSPLPWNHFGEAKLEGDIIYLPRSNFYLTRINEGDKISRLENYKQIRIGQVVWARWKKFEWWPAVVEAFKDNEADNSVYVRWINEPSYTLCEYNKVFPFDYAFHLQYNARRKDDKYQDSVAKAILMNGLVGYWEPYMKEQLFHRMATHVEFHGMLSHIPENITKELLNLPCQSETEMSCPWDFSQLEKLMSNCRGGKEPKVTIQKVDELKLEGLFIKFYILQRNAFPSGQFFPTSWKMLIQFLENRNSLDKKKNGADQPSTSGNEARLTDNELEQIAKNGKVPGYFMDKDDSKDNETKDPKEQKKSKETKPPKKSKETKPPKKSKDTKAQKEAKATKAQKESKETKAQEESKETEAQKESTETEAQEDLSADTIYRPYYSLPFPPLLGEDGDNRKLAEDYGAPHRL